MPIHHIDDTGRIFYGRIVELFEVLTGEYFEWNVGGSLVRAEAVASEVGEGLLSEVADGFYVLLGDFGGEIFWVFPEFEGLPVGDEGAVD